MLTRALTFTLAVTNSLSHKTVANQVHILVVTLYLCCRLCFLVRAGVEAASRGMKELRQELARMEVSFDT